MQRRLITFQTESELTWQLAHRAYTPARKIADRHYNRQKPGTPQFVPPGSCLVLYQPNALWVTSWPMAEYVKHEWAGAWVNSCFRNEGAGLSSTLIREAIAATRWHYDEVPALGMITFVDTEKVRSTNPGYCYLCAGFRRVGHTKGGLVALQMLPKDMPSPAVPIGAQRTLNLHYSF